MLTSEFTLPIMSSEFSSNIAMSILDRELELDSNPTPTLVHELVDLYSNAIEYFETQQDSRYLDFQHRMHNMLARPDILHLLQLYNTPEKPQRKESTASSVSSRHRRNTLSVDVTRKGRKELLSQQVTSELGSPVMERRMQRLVSSHQSSVKGLTKRTKHDLESQELSLERRLAIRKNENSSRTIVLSLNDSLTPSEENFELDLSDISEKEDNPMAESFRYEEQIEDIMERNFAEKASRVAEVRVKYAPQIAELESQGSIGVMIVKQMQAQMDKEIQEINEDIDSRRKDEIAELKKANLSSILY